jgi:hypothetical protein
MHLVSTVSFLRRVGFVAALGLTACSASNPTTPDAAVPTGPVPTSPPDLAPGERRLEGQLAYKPLPTEKSVEAYLGVEFTIDIGTEKVLVHRPRDGIKQPRADRRRARGAATKRYWVVTGGAATKRSSTRCRGP